MVTNRPTVIPVDAPSERTIRAAFLVSVTLKAFNAALETLLGMVLFFSAQSTSVVLFFIQKELVEDPTDFLATSIRNLLQQFPLSGQQFGAFYLLSHGVIKLFLAWGLLRDRLWAYPASIMFLSLFIVYQLVKFATTGSLFMLALSIFDAFVLWLIFHEYRLRIGLRRRGAN